MQQLQTCLLYLSRKRNGAGPLYLYLSLSFQVYPPCRFLSRTHHQHHLPRVAGNTQGALRPLAAHWQWLPAQDGSGARPWVTFLHLSISQATSLPLLVFISYFVIRAYTYWTNSRDELRGAKCTSTLKSHFNIFLETGVFDVFWVWFMDLFRA